MAEHGVETAALMGLPGATSARLAKLLQTTGAQEAWTRVCAGAVGTEVASAAVAGQWREHGAAVDLDHVRCGLRRRGLVATCWHDSDHPPPFTADIDPAPVAVRSGRPLGDGARVGIVGTRRCSAVGREIAFDLGRGLAQAGVGIVSGLALGVDGAAHRGALAAAGAPPIAVVGSGADVVYPRRHERLWADVVSHGSLFTEVPLGGPPEPWRFPARNRLIAALSDVLVVVESRSAGGSLLTVEQAARRDVPVMAVPGSLRNPAAAGTNQLLADGCAPARDVDDVLVALGLTEAGAAARRRGERLPRPDPAPLDPTSGTVLDAVDDGPTTLDQLASRTDLAVPVVLTALEELRRLGLVDADGARFIRAARDPRDGR